jgi:hypothetical protein
MRLTATVRLAASGALLLAAGPAFAQKAEVTLLCDYVRTPWGPGNFPAFSATYHLSDGSWHETQTIVWRNDAFCLGDRSGQSDCENVRVEIDRATAVASMIRGPGTVVQKGQCRKFEGRQF